MYRVPSELENNNLYVMKVASKKVATKDKVATTAIDISPAWWALERGSKPIPVGILSNEGDNGNFLSSFIASRSLFNPH
jgi:hypothetical protein